MTPARVGPGGASARPVPSAGRRRALTGPAAARRRPRWPASLAGDRPCARAAGAAPYRSRARRRASASRPGVDLALGVNEGMIVTSIDLSGISAA